MQNDWKKIQKGGEQDNTLLTINKPAQHSAAPGLFRCSTRLDP